ncbi:MAG: leucine--tRNA ligase [Gammaproteobacteria bacterium]|nr:leucine--tRNA ligase [Gammaproteobacteria bacterium]RPG25913.1 MAG: leucine--tRNA ligase [Gammaproteobacteria bacterium TMED50]
MSENKSYSVASGEEAVQSYWAENETFAVTENDPREKFYCLSMFPYPSGQLHMGHVRNFTLGDVISRFQRLKGKNVLHPIGWDAFGLPAENAAIKRNVPPAEWTHSNIEYMQGQMKRLGFSFDWNREFATCDSSYYRWEQWFFTRMFRKGLVYKKAAWVNWDPVDQTVLANEQVIDGRGWRSDAPVERRELSQWFVHITEYAEELLDFLDRMPGWPDKVKTMQRNWIGRSQGVEMTFPMPESPVSDITGVDVYTTRPDTLLGATYLAVAPQHPLATSAAEEDPELLAFLDKCNQTSVAEADMAKLPKEGMFSGLYAKHPLTDEDIPIWVANFVLMEYGSGAVMSVPAHDQRDCEFARKYGLPIKQVVKPKPDSDESCDIASEAYVSKNGVVMGSGEYDGLDFDAAFDAIAEALESKSLGKRTVNYRLRDWLVSRQRYWGCPIPIIHCDHCGPVPVPDKELPITLPDNVSIDGSGSPLSKMPDWYNTSCPDCGKDAVRDTDTFDTFMESSWYYARFASADCSEGMLDERMQYWRNVDHYVGGEEHAILHLLYARFFHKVMRDEGLVDSDEPFEKLLSLGMVLKDGAKMSKSAGDAGDPQVLLNKHGADAVRMAMMFAAPPEQSFEWSEHGVESAEKWLRNRLWARVQEHLAHGTPPELEPDQLNDEQKELRRVTHETLAKAEDDYGRRLAFNTVVSAVMSMMGQVSKFQDTSPQGLAVMREALSAAIVIMSPITPHICHVLWQELHGKAMEDASWPVVDESAMIANEVELIVQVNGKLRAKLTIAMDASEEEAEAAARDIENVLRFLADKTVRKVIHVPNRLINFVVG